MKSKMDINPVFSKKTIAIHNFVDKVPYPIETKTDILNQLSITKPYVLYFGRYSREKGMITLLEACRRLPEVRFVFAGRGEYESEIEGIANIVNVGFRTGDELDDLISNALLSVIPSEWYENNPFSVMVSKKRLTPVLGANIGGIPELIDDGKTGWIFTSRNAYELTNKIRDIWENPIMAEECREQLKQIELKDTSEYIRVIYPGI